MFPWSKTPSGKSRPGSEDTRRRHPPCVRVRFISAANWWLRYPYCNSNNGATNALNVNTNGNWSNNNCSNAGYAIRPALLFSSSLLVSIEDEEAADEASIYSGYVDYVREWMDEDPDVGSSPMTYEEWKKDGGQEDA